MHEQGGGEARDGGGGVRLRQGGNVNVLAAQQTHAFGGLSYISYTIALVCACPPCCRSQIAAYGYVYSNLATTPAQQRRIYEANIQQYV